MRTIVLASFWCTAQKCKFCAIRHFIEMLILKANVSSLSCLKWLYEVNQFNDVYAVIQRNFN